MNESHDKKLIESARQRASRHRDVADLSSINEFVQNPFEGESEEASLVLGDTQELETTDSESSSIKPGTTIHQYRILRKIGEGGMGEVYLAQHLKFKSRLFAIKFLRRELMDAGAKKRFEAEIGAMELLKHDNIVYAHDAGEFDGSSYLVMDFVEGVTVKSLTVNGPVSVANAAEIVRQTALGLQHATENNLVHRDIKPSNLILSKDGQVKILDMGLARINDANSSQLTATQQVLGTPDYMAPEQWRDTKSVDIRADIYSLGCTLYFLLAGRAPYEDNEHSSLATKLSGHLQEPPPKIKIQPECDGLNGIENILSRMLEKEPEQRFQTPLEVANAIGEFCDGSDVGIFTKDIKPIDIDQFPTKSIQDALEDTQTRQKTDTNNETDHITTVNELKQGMKFLSIGVCVCILLIGCFIVAYAMGLFESNDNNNATGTIANKKEDSTHSAGKVEAIDPHFSVQYISRSNPDLPANHEEQELFEEGTIGENIFTGKFGDLLTVSFQLAEPKYVYLVALNPTNDPKYRIQLCYPASRTQAPEQVSNLTYPSNENAYFGMTDGLGQIAFVLIKSELPLPDFETWQSEHLEAGFPWAISKQTGVWETNEKGELVRRAVQKNKISFRGDVMVVKSNVLENSIQYLRSKKVDVEVVAFPVLDK